MLNIHLPAEEYYDEKNEEFVYLDAVDVKMEHSLLSLSKWEAHYKKPFLADVERTTDETIYYLKCMALDETLPLSVFKRMAAKQKIVNQIYDYLKDPACATTISKRPDQQGRKEIITAEIIYYDMVALQIPLSLETWNLNRLLTFIQVCSIKNEPPKKTSMNDRLGRIKSINDANRAKFGM